MQTFQLNGQTVRFFQLKEIIYLVTADANKAFGFTSNQTSIDDGSIAFSQALMTGLTGDATTDGLETLPDKTLVVELKKLLLVILRSRKPEMENMQDILSQQLAKAFAQNFGIQKERPMLPATTDDKRVTKLAASVASRKLSSHSSQDLINLPDWQTVTQMLGELGESIDDETSLAKNDEFRFWINRNMSDIYRAQEGEEPPTVDRKLTKEAKTRAYCYPPSFFGLVQLFRSEWLNRRG